MKLIQEAWADYQQSVKNHHKKMKKKLISHGDQPNVSPYTDKPSFERSKSAPPGFGALEEIDQAEIEKLKIKDTLNPSFWDGNNIRDDVKNKLNEIVYDFYNDLKIKTNLKDIKFTGSNASYNWHNESDVDIHLVMNFLDISDNYELVREMYLLKKADWNYKNNILIKGHPVEIYIEDVNDTHYANGIYSLLKDKWIKFPSKNVEDFDEKEVIQKAEHFISQIDPLKKLLYLEKHDEVLDLVHKLMKKLKTMRKNGLDDDGIFSIENLTFKVLRNNDFIKKLKNIALQAYEDKMSLKEHQEHENNF